MASEMMNPVLGLARPVFALVRLGAAVNGTFLDLVFAESLGVSHPFPVKDARDDQALAQAAL